MRTASALLLLALAAGPARAKPPLSAIDWLSRSVATPAALPRSVPLRPRAAAAPVTTTSIDAPSPDAAGILPASVTGLPRDLWGPTPTARIVDLLRGAGQDELPALRALRLRLVLAESDPPVDADGTGTLFLARVDLLLDLGALDQARALLDAGGAATPEAFRRAFDVALLVGDEDAACATMRGRPDISPTLPARIFCLARGGDWSGAALTLRAGESLGLVSPDMTELLDRFLDPDLAEAAPDLAVPPLPSPLAWRMFEAIGEPIATNSLPVAFAQADLRDNAGWKARIEAAERLARSGAMPVNRLIGLYLERKPAASGGVWDRVAAIQAFDAAFRAKDVPAIATTLPPAYGAMAEIELEAAFSEVYGAELAALPLGGEARRVALEAGLLSPDYERVARAVPMPAPSPRTAFFIGVAVGAPAGIAPPDGLGAAIRDGLAAKPPADLAGLIADGRIGEAALVASDRLTGGTRGNLRGVTEGLATLRALGLEDTARRAALELMLLERRG